MQAVKLSEFFEICRNLDFGRGQKYVKIEKVIHSGADFLFQETSY